MPRIKSVKNPAWVKQRKLLMLSALVSSNETILDSPPTTMSKGPDALFNWRNTTVMPGSLSNRQDRALDPMTGKFVPAVEQVQ